ncbi:MAG: putative addiction module antidote protein, CopG/Arc/MetJ family [Proteobacteria bacterium]|nr:putative addiction module antidote protein, CopG/Arc/MetJ family [Pseudomonadota bacterium]
MPSSYTLGDRFEGFVKQLVASGRYASASEVLRDGLRLLEEQENLRQAKLDALRRDIDEGLDSGPSEPLDMEAIIEEARQLRKSAKKPSHHGA